MCKLVYLDHTEKGLGDTFPVSQILPAIQHLSTLPPTVRAWVTAEQLGEMRIAVGSRLPRAVQTYWEEEQRQGRAIPQVMQEALQQRADRLRRDPRRTWAQQGLQYEPAKQDADEDGEGYADEEGEDEPQRRDTWEAQGQHCRERGLPLTAETCILHMKGQLPKTFHLPCSTKEGLPVTGVLKLEQAEVHLYHGNQRVWSGERAKMHQWMMRGDGLTRAAIASGGTHHANHTTEREAEG